MNKSLALLAQEFESDSRRTPQYLEFHRTFKREFSKALTSMGCSKVEIGKPNHFDVSGFFTGPNEQIWWFRLEDLRWNKDTILIRTAKHYKDYTGGPNQWVRTTNIVDGVARLLNR